MIDVLTLGHHVAAIILVGLPGTHLNQGLVVVAEVNQQEQDCLSVKP